LAATIASQIAGRTLLRATHNTILSWLLTGVGGHRARLELFLLRLHYRAGGCGRMERASHERDRFADALTLSADRVLDRRQDRPVMAVTR
jgi:hypothetical protein